MTTNTKAKRKFRPLKDIDKNFSTITVFLNAVNEECSMITRAAQTILYEISSTPRVMVER